MIPALLVGGWDNSQPADKRVLEELSGLPYESLARDLTALLKGPDSPLRKVDTAWKIASPRDAWFRLASSLTSGDLDKFTGLVADVLGSADPRFNLEPDERWRTDLFGKDATYSGFIRMGMAEVLVLMSVFVSRVSSTPHAKSRVDGVVKRLLGKADAERWWSLHLQLHVLAEASPDAFLTAVEESLALPDRPIMKLFAEGTDDFFGGGGVYPHLLSALEVLAWSPDYLTRVTNVLAALTKLDPGGRTNRPESSFMQIYRLWYPQTSATLDQRNAVLNQLRKVEPEASWGLLLNLYPRSYDTSHDAPVPRWRDFSAERPEGVTHATIFRGAQAIGNWLLEDVGTNADRWISLIDRLSDFAPELRSTAIDRLNGLATKVSSNDERAALQQALRKFLNHHRQFPDAEWSLKKVELGRIEHAYHLLEPKDELLKIKWLFDDHHPPVVDPKGRYRWDTDNAKAFDSARKKAVAQLVKDRGVDGVLELAKSAKFPTLVGRAYAQIIKRKELPQVFVDALKANGAANWDFAHGAIALNVYERPALGEKWADKLLDRALKERWGNLAVERLLLSLPPNERFMQRVASIGGEAEAAYWSKIDPFRIKVPDTAISGIVERLLKAKRARAATSYAGHHFEHISSDLFIRTLTHALAEEPPKANGNDSTMFQHYVTNIFEKLDQDSSVAVNDLARLEWGYLRLLEHSNRQPKTLPKLLAISPEFFVEVLSAVYKGQHEERGLDKDAPDYEARAAIATQAWTLLHSWRHVPGTVDGKIDGTELDRWVRKTRALCAGADREIIGDQQIGQVLAYAPADDDGTWPCKPVRDLIESIRSEEMEKGILTGIVNSRGITTRSPIDGGAQERALAHRYRSWSEITRLEYPRTSAVLTKIAENYDWDAKHHDNDAERGQW